MTRGRASVRTAGSARETAWSAVIALPFGRVAVAVDDEKLVAIRIVSTDQPPIPPRVPLARAAMEQLLAYSVNRNHKFTLPLAPALTPFQARVRTALIAIPVGTTWTYRHLATLLGSSPRAVGGACRRNPLPIVIPCHRVVAVNGIGGYGGQLGRFWVGAKTQLLWHEKTRSSDNPGFDIISSWHL